MTPVIWHWAPESGGPACGEEPGERGIVPELARVVSRLPIPDSDMVCTKCLDLERDDAHASGKEVDTVALYQARVTLPSTDRRTRKGRSRKRRRPEQLPLFPDIP